MPGDAATEAGVELLHAAALAHLGTVDGWFGNAGVDAGRGLQTAESDWATSGT